MIDCQVYGSQIQWKKQNTCIVWHPCMFSGPNAIQQLCNPLWKLSKYIHICTFFLQKAQGESLCWHCSLFNIKGVLWQFGLVEQSGYSRLCHLKLMSLLGKRESWAEIKRGPWYCKPLWSNPSVSVLVQNRHNTAVLWIITHFRIRNTVTSLPVFIHSHSHTC